MTPQLYVTPRPCDRCPMRTDRSSTPPQRAALQSAADSGLPFVCRTMDPGPNGRLRICTGWLVVAWRKSAWAIAAVRERRLTLAELRADPDWPALHRTVADAVEARVPGQQRRRVVVPFRARRG